MKLIPLAVETADTVSSWAPIALMLVIAIGFGVGQIVLSSVIGPSRTGAVKESTYESGMVPIGDTKKRFNVRFYIVAMIFLVVDVDIIFFYPWATMFSHSVASGAMVPELGIRAGTLMLIDMLIFIAILLLAYAYAWGKGVFRWD